MILIGLCFAIRKAYKKQHGMQYLPDAIILSARYRKGKRMVFGTEKRPQLTSKLSFLELSRRKSDTQ